MPFTEPSISGICNSVPDIILILELWIVGPTSTPIEWLFSTDKISLHPLFLNRTKILCRITFFYRINEDNLGCGFKALSFLKNKQRGTFLFTVELSYHIRLLHYHLIILFYWDEIEFNQITNYRPKIFPEIVFYLRNTAIFSPFKRSRITYDISFRFIYLVFFASNIFGYVWDTCIRVLVLLWTEFSQNM